MHLKILSFDIDDGGLNHLIKQKSTVSRKKFVNFNITLVDGLLYECYCQARHYLSVCDCFHGINIVP